MGIERNKRKPKRRRTTAQRLKGRMSQVFTLPPAAATPAAAPKTKKVRDEEVLQRAAETGVTEPPATQGKPSAEEKPKAAKHAPRTKKTDAKRAPKKVPKKN